MLAWMMGYKKYMDGYEWRQVVLMMMMIVGIYTKAIQHYFSQLTVLICLEQVSSRAISAASPSDNPPCSWPLQDYPYGTD